MRSTFSEDRPIRWGVLGAGSIAARVCDDISLSNGNVVSAVGARDAGRAADFAVRHGVERSYGSYEALVDDHELDVIYIATTHPHHRANALLAIGAGKAVLIEKPVALNAAGGREIFAAAAAAKVFAMEAMWMRMNPLIQRAQHLVQHGAIGEIRGVRAELSLGQPFDARHRLYDRANGGGALLDLGIYPATLAFVFLGRPDDVCTMGTLSPTGADDTVVLQWAYDGIPRAQLMCSISASVPNEAVVYGTRGWISFAAPIYRPTGLTVHTDERTYQIDDPIAGHGSGYGPEIEEVERCLRLGLEESPAVPHAETIAILEVLDQSRAVLGVTYPGE